MFGFKKKEKSQEDIKAEEERKKYKLDIAKAKREAYWVSRKEAEVTQAKARGSSYKSIGKSFGEGLGNIGRGMTAKGGFLDMSGVSSKGKKSSGFGIGEPSSEFGDWLGGSTRTTKRHRTHHKPKHRVHKHKGHRRVKIIEYY
jgi:hypothetical protein